MSDIIAIVGPTGVGKTRLSIKLAKELDGEIINADSTQVYRGLDIATAKATKEEQEGVKHHLIDIKDVEEDYSVYDFQKDAQKKIEEIKKRGKTPILVGGTGLYLKALLYGYDFEKEEAFEPFDEITTKELYETLVSLDPDTKIHKNNRKRIVRAINYTKSTGKPFSKKPKHDKLVYDATVIGLNADRKKLYEVINQRVDNMLEDGLLREAKDLYDRNIRTKAVMTPIGYKELFHMYDGIASLDEVVDLIKKNSRNYSKRQLTWFNNQMDVKWFDVNYDHFDKTVEDVIAFLKEKRTD